VRFQELDHEHRSELWYASRLGRLNSSDAADMLASIKSGEAAGRRNLRVRLVLERITGTIDPAGWTSKPTQRGLDMEPEALAIYEAMTGNMLRAPGYVQCTEHMAGASPDGVIGAFEGIAEVKCPLAATHLEYLKTGRVPANYQAQVIHQLWVTGAMWADWMSYHPDFPEPLRCKLVHIKRDDQALRAYEAQALEFLGEVDVEEQLIRGMSYGGTDKRRTEIVDPKTSEVVRPRA